MSGHGLLRAACVVPLVILAWTGVTWGQVAEGTHVPVVVNLYTGSGTTEAEAREAIAEANKILAQAGVKLHVVKVNNPPAGNGGDDGSGGGTAGDGDFTRDEREKARKFGEKEIEGIRGKKGIKISFGRTPVVGSLSPGVSIHTIPTIIVKKGAAAGGATGTGSTIAHEFGHVMTLDVGHLINPGPPPVTADPNDAHAPNTPGVNGNGNLMSPSDERNGTHLTQSQIDEIKKRLCGTGWCSKQFDYLFPGQKERQDYGGKADNIGDDTGPSRLYDLDSIRMWSLDRLADVEAHIVVSTPLPEDQEIDVVYEIGLDIDANASTGTGLAGMTGVDRILRVTASGNIGLGTFQVTGEVTDTLTSSTVPLPTPPIVKTEFEFPSQGAPAEPAKTSVLLTVPKGDLDLSATGVPIIAVAGDGVSPFDTATFIYDTDADAGMPTLQPGGTGVPTPGEPYPFQITGLAPNTTFNLYLDDTHVMTGSLNGTGSFNGSFIFPANVSNGVMHFLTAQDPSGSIGYNITCPELGSIPAHSPLGLVVLFTVIAASGSILLGRRLARDRRRQGSLPP